MTQSNFEKFVQWKESVQEQDLKQLIARNGATLNREALCKEIGFGRTAFKGSANKELYELLLEFEEELRGLNILLPQPQAGKNKDKKPSGELSASDPVFAELHRMTKENQILKSENRKVLNENLELKAQLRKLNELSEVIADLGLLGGD